MNKDRICSQFCPLYIDREARELYTGTIFHRDRSIILEMQRDQQSYLRWLKIQDL